LLDLNTPQNANESGITKGLVGSWHASSPLAAGSTKLAAGSTKLAAGSTQAWASKFRQITAMV
jgi:X-X-X-Leu-X-X-Gly heptad repeat protein